jgi:hypothetical protein
MREGGICIKNDFEKKAKELLGESKGSAVIGKQGELKKIASSKEGRAVIDMLNKKRRYERPGKRRCAALRGTMSELLSTEDGTKLMKQLSELLNNL